MAERTGQVGRSGRGRVSGPRRDDDDDFDEDGDRRRGRGLRSLFVLAASGVLVYLVWSIMWERNHPAGSAARLVLKGDSAARLKVIRDLERLGPEDPEIALLALAEELADPEPFNRTAAVDGLLTVIQHVGPSGSAPDGVGVAVATLMGRLDDPQPMVRRRAVQALWTIVLMWQGTPGVLELDRMVAAMSRMAGDRDPEIRSVAVRGLGVVGRRISDDPPPRLVASLDDESESIRTAAARALSTYHRGLARLLPELVKGLETTRPECRPAYVRILREIQPGLNDAPPPEELVPALASALGSRDREVRRLVAGALGLFGDGARAAIPALIALLNERDDSGSPGRPANPGAPGGNSGPGQAADTSDTVVVAIDALRQVAGTNLKHDPYGAETIVPPVQEAVAALKPLLASADPRRRAGAIDALRWFSPDAALVPALGEAVADPAASVRTAALLTLQKYAGAAAKLDFPPPKAVTRALEDDEPRVRQAAAEALGSFRSGVDPMVPALIRHGGHDPDPQVRAGCAHALGRLGPPAITPALLPEYVAAIEGPGLPSELRENLIEGLCRFGPPARVAVPAIIRALRSARARIDGPDPDMRAVMLRDSAARALGRLAPGTAFASEAIAALADSVDDQGVPIAQALGEFGPAAGAAAPALLRVLRRARDRKSPLAVASFAEALNRVAPGAPEADEALTVLDDYLNKLDANSPFADAVIAAVARFGPRAAPVLPRLHELTGAGAPQVLDAARKAVAAIEGSGR